MKSTEGDVEKDWKKEFDDLSNQILSIKPFQFDCKVWNVPTPNDVFAWFLYRQLDCIRNSKQQTAQTWLSHNKLIGVDSDKQVEMLKNENGVDWNEFEPEVKFGRLIKKVEKEVSIPEQFVKDDVTTTIRTFWEPFPMPILSEMDGKDELMKMIPQ